MHIPHDYKSFAKCAGYYFILQDYFKCIALIKISDYDTLFWLGYDYLYK